MKALERQEATQDDAEEMILLSQAGSVPASAVDLEDSGMHQLNRQFTESTLVSVPAGRPHQSSGLSVEHDLKAFLPSAWSSHNGMQENARKTSSGKSTVVGSDETHPENATPDLEEVVDHAMQELFRARQKEHTAKPLRIRPQDPVHRPSESTKRIFEELAKDEMDYRRPNARDLLRLGTWWLLKVSQLDCRHEALLIVSPRHASTRSPSNDRNRLRHMPASAQVQAPRCHHGKLMSTS